MPGPSIVRPQPGDEITSTWGQSVADSLNGIQVGSATIGISGASNGTVVVVFPKPYTAAPRVFLTVASVSSNTQAHAWIASAGVTATQVTVAAGRDDSTAVTATVVVGWMAVGTLA